MSKLAKAGGDKIVLNYERSPYKYNESFSKAVNDMLELLHNMYEDADFILSDKDKNLELLAQWSTQFIGETDRGILRTLLIILKPFRNETAIHNIFEICANELRKGSDTGRI